MTPDKLIEYCEDSGIAIENLEASKYYDSLGKIDYITTSLAVVEDDGKFFKTIYHNKKYEEALVHDDIPSILVEFDSNPVFRQCKLQ